MPRRGLLAVGLAVSIVGAVGVASIINAQADEFAPAPVPAAAPVAERKHLPPPLLPWGEKPTRGKVGRAGTGSDALRVQGLDAAPAAGGRAGYGGREAPKGRSGKTTFLKSEATDVALPAPGAAPPEPSGAAEPTDVAEPAPTTSSSNGKAYYFYNLGRQVAESDGFYNTVTIAKPTLGKYDYHTLAELAVQSADSKQIVEVGWTVDRVVNRGDGVNPHLFVYHWVNGLKSCYNGCGFVPYDDATVKAGDILTTGSKRFGIEYFDEAWWISYDSNFVGYFPESLWTDEGVKAFDKTGLVQTFGEVASTIATPCSQMGNGAPGTDKTAAVLGSLSYVNGPTAALEVPANVDNTYYTPNRLSGRTFQYGGQGSLAEICKTTTS